MKKTKRTKEWLAEEQSLKSQALLLLGLSGILKDQAAQNCNEVIAYTTKYSEAEVESLPWDKKEKFYAKAEELANKLRKSYEAVQQMDKDYDALRQKVNRFYGKEVMKKYDPLIVPEIEDDKRDDADWWKV